jgi:hypothetical protein
VQAERHLPERNSAYNEWRARELSRSAQHETATKEPGNSATRDLAHSDRPHVAPQAQLYRHASPDGRARHRCWIIDTVPAISPGRLRNGRPR